MVDKKHISENIGRKFSSTTIESIANNIGEEASRVRYKYSGNAEVRII